MGKKITLLVFYFGVLFALLSTSMLYLLSLNFSVSNGVKNNLFKLSYLPNYQALPSSSFGISAVLGTSDFRVDALESFLGRYDSPLKDHSSKIVREADNNGIDYRLIPAIAMQESTLCKRIPKNSYNCWGFGVYGDKITKFENYEQAIEVVTKTMAKEYIAKGLETPEEIMSKYTPSNNGEWADAVSYVMDRIESTF